MGYLHLTRNALVWKWHWATCRADGWTVVERGKTSWTLELKQTPAEVKGCLGVRFVEIQPNFPDSNKSIWAAAGLQFKGQADKDLPIACSFLE